jgi:hypothetical protein
MLFEVDVGDDELENKEQEEKDQCCVLVEKYEYDSPRYEVQSDIEQRLEKGECLLIHSDGDDESYFNDIVGDCCF